MSMVLTQIHAIALHFEVGYCNTRKVLIMPAAWSRFWGAIAPQKLCLYGYVVHIITAATAFNHGSRYGTQIL